MAKSSKYNTEHWMNAQWRPAIAILYIVICTFDFIIFPIYWISSQSHAAGAILTQWVPLTLQNGGMFHMAFGAILGITAYGRTQEKLNGVLTAAAAPLSTTPDPEL